MYLKLEPKTSDRKYWEEVYKKANEIRDQYHPSNASKMELIYYTFD